MKTIAVATDFSERSDRAMRRATLLARQHDAHLRLFHVVDNEQPAHLVDDERTRARALLDRMAETMRTVDGVSCDALLFQSAPFAGIVKASEEIAPDLLVIGPHRRQPLKDAFSGTTAERAMRAIRCPTLIANGLPAGHYRHILQTTDLSDASRDALQRFATLGLERGLRSAMLHIFEVPALRLARMDTPLPKERDFLVQEARNAVAQELSGFLLAAGLAGMRTILRPNQSTVPHEVAQAADEEAADLIVISTRGRGGISKFVLGSVAEQILATARLDILAIPPARS